MSCLGLLRPSLFPFAVIIFTFACLGQCPTAAADSLVSWDLSSLDYTGFADNSPVPNPVLPSTTANVQTGLVVSDLTSAGLLTSVGNLIAGEGNFKNWDVGGDGVNDNFLEFTVETPVTGGLFVESLSVTLWRNGGGAPNGIAFDVSIDGGDYMPYGALQVDTNAGDKIFDTFTFDDTTIANHVSQLGIRFTPRNAGAGSTGNLHISSLELRGTAFVPEPGSSTLFLIGLLMLTRKCRRA